MGLRKKLAKANLRDFRKGKAKLIKKTPDAVKYLAAPVYLPARAGLEAAEIFGSTVEAVRPALQASKGKSTTTRATLAGVAGSVGFFASAGKTVAKTGKRIFDATPASVKKVVGPAAGLVAGVVAIPIAARYLAPSAAVKAGQAAVVGTAKAGAAIVTPDGNQVPGADRSEAATPDPGIAEAGSRAGPDAGSGGSKSGAAAAAAGSSRGRKPAKPRSRASGGGGDRKRRKPVRRSRDASPVVAPRSRDRSGSRRRRSRSGSGDLRPVTAQEAKVLRSLEEGGWEVGISPR